MADEAQPDMGQGDTGSAGLFDSYLQAVPEDARPHVEQYLADAARNVNSRLEEAAQLRSTFEPLSQVEGLAQYRPEELQQLIGWHQQISADPAAYRTWIADAAKEAGLEVAADEQSELQSELTQDTVRELTQQGIAPLEERLQQWEQAQWVQQESDLIGSKLAELEQSHGVTLDTDQRREILTIAESIAAETDSLQGGKDWITPGFELYQKIVARGAQQLVDDKANQPRPGLAPGGVGVFELPKTFDEARARATERLRQSRSM